MTDQSEEPITAQEYKQLIARLQADGFDSTPIGEALLGAIKKLGQKAAWRESECMCGRDADPTGRLPRLSILCPKHD